MGICVGRDGEECVYELGDPYSKSSLGVKGLSHYTPVTSWLSNSELGNLLLVGVFKDLEGNVFFFGYGNKEK